MTRTDISLDRLVSKYGLERHNALIQDGVEPAVRLNVGSKAGRSLRIGTSKFGGLPHLAEGTFWPVRPNAEHPLQFLAQFHLASLPEECREAVPLPRDGWLYFWFDILADWQSNHTCLLRPESREYPFGWVTFAPEEAPLLRSEFPELREPKVPANQKLPHYQPPMFRPYSEHRVSFRRALSLDKDSLKLLLTRADEMTEEDVDSNEWSRALEMMQEMHGHRRGKRRIDHRLLGSVHEPLGTDMRVDAQRFYEQRTGKPASDDLKSWIMLAKFDSDDTIQHHEQDAGWRWGNGGSLCFWIRRTDLENTDFEKAVAVIGNTG
ncbi:DUF1963 domain-containing protein [Bremerella cremea]|uniref:DUF1963 domain-containing protein n=1 Tax=Bremerella cremea TaxID=1031537 RepID=A0A368KVE8_9BACT|nr:DUF1963 domain-containing protein [Bremerella cremea]RCS52701.1 DUF1963 domain-containing protein [Bremerella cremea]